MTKQKKTSEEPGVPRRNNSKQILDAAEKVFSVHGLSGTRIEDIARACGLPKANVLYYFSTKEKLYKATLERVLGHWLANAELHLSAEQDPAEGLRQYVLSKMAFRKSTLLHRVCSCMNCLQVGGMCGGSLKQPCASMLPTVSRFLRYGRKKV